MITIFDHNHNVDNQAGYSTMYAGKYLNQVLTIATEEDFDVDDNSDD